MKQLNIKTVANMQRIQEYCKLYANGVAVFMCVSLIARAVAALRLSNWFFTRSITRINSSPLPIKVVMIMKFTKNDPDSARNIEAKTFKSDLLGAIDSSIQASNRVKH